MCEPLLLKAAKSNGVYDFEKVFENSKRLFSESDIVIGNLETPMAGERAGYTDSLFSFNTPDSFADAVKKAGIDLVLTANNHCLDRDIDGLIRTMRVLDEKGIPFAGTSEPNTTRREATYLTVNGVKVAVISYTYGTNYSSNHIQLSEEEQKLVNLLRPQNELYYIPKKSSNLSFHKRVINKILLRIPEEKRFYVKKYLGMTVNIAHNDDNLNKETVEKYLSQLRADIEKAKEKADVVIFCPHIGGQFNSEPGVFSKYIFQEAASYGCDAIVASHTHVVLKSEIINGIRCFYSLGNFSMSPNSVYLIRENLPDYGIAAHLYVDNKRIRRIGFSILKIVERKNSCLTVYPLDEYVKLISDEEEIRKIESQAEMIYSVVTGKTVSHFIVQKEYEIHAF